MSFHCISYYRGNFESWYEEWLKTARRIHSYADECMSKDHTISARAAYLRASNYYRTAEFLLVEPEDPRIQNTIDLSKEWFRKAVPLFPFVVDCIEIPYKETTLPGYFYHAPKEHINHKNKQYDNKNDNEKKGINYNETTTVNAPPTLIVHEGFDSTLEELYSSAAVPALERGYNCLAFEGPGQGNVIRKQKIPFRYDWEKVVTPVIEFMISKKKEFHIDPKRIALMGISMGGYLAARAAAFEPRISAIILYNGVFDGYDAIKSGFPTSLLDEIERGNSEFVNTELTNLMESDSNVKFNMKHGMWTTGTSSPYELIIGAKEFSSKEILKNIKSPTLVLEGE